MPVSIKNFTVTITIGGNIIILDSDSINKGLDDLDQADPLSEHLQNGLSFKMRKGTTVSVTVQDLVGWFESNFSGHVTSLGDDVKGFINRANKNDSNTLPADTSALDSILIDLSDLYFSATKNPNLALSFGFTLKVTLDPAFYTSLGLDGISNIISLNSVGFSLAYTN